MKRLLIAAGGCLLLASCATPPQNIKADASAAGQTCTAADRQRLDDLYHAQSRTATQDALGVFMIGVPLGGADNAPEIARLKGRCGDPSKKKPA